MTTKLPKEIIKFDWYSESDLNRYAFAGTRFLVQRGYQLHHIPLCPVLFYVLAEQLYHVHHCLFSFVLQSFYRLANSQQDINFHLDKQQLTGVCGRGQHHSPYLTQKFLRFSRESLAAFYTVALDYEKWQFFFPFRLIIADGCGRI